MKKRFQHRTMSTTMEGRTSTVDTTSEGGIAVTLILPLTIFYKTNPYATPLYVECKNISIS